ncbi:MAG: glycine cleavage T C-terminal barrel domain-containing protein [Planctomycetota bacterium]
MRTSPARERLLSHEASFIPYSPPSTGESEPPEPVEVVEIVDGLDLEYAAVRTKAGLFDQPHRGVIEVTGGERTEFLNNMITQELKDLEPFGVTHSFWLNRKGRIDADLRLISLPERILFDLDVFTARPTAEALSNFIFSEDCTLTDASETTHRLGLYGPTAARVLEEVAMAREGDAIGQLADRRATIVEIAGTEVVVARDDWLGVPCFELFAPASGAESVHAALEEAGAANNPSAPPNSEEGRVALRPIGWHAVNLARVEAGCPMLFLDFGHSNLPAESGSLEDRVSFTKGCYLGQEVVARMHALGKPKQTLVALRFDAATAETAQPTTGAHVSLPDEPGATIVGSVTSSSISPMLGAEPVAFAMLKTKHAEAGSRVVVEVGGNFLPAFIQPSLRFWPQPGTDS